jgi:hypothetical protein
LNNQPSPSELLDAIIFSEWKHGAEIGVRISTLSECCWEGELRYTPFPNQRNQADKGYVFYVSGGGSADDILTRLTQEFVTWIAEHRL